MVPKVYCTFDGEKQCHHGARLPSLALLLVSHLVVRGLSLFTCGDQAALLAFLSRVRLAHRWFVP